MSKSIFTTDSQIVIIHLITRKNNRNQIKYCFEYKAVVVLRKISIGKDLRAVKSTIEYIKEKHIDIITDINEDFKLYVFFK